VRRIMHHRYAKLLLVAGNQAFSQGLNVNPVTHVIAVVEDVLERHVQRLGVVLDDLGQNLGIELQICLFGFTRTLDKGDQLLLELGGFLFSGLGHAVDDVLLKVLEDLFAFELGDL
jgi:hypothetical protein